MSSDEAKAANEEERDQKQPSPTVQQDEAGGKQSDESASLTGNRQQQQQQQQQQQHQHQQQQQQHEYRGGRFAGSDRPLTMRERARLQEIEVLEEELSQIGESLPNARRLLELEIHRLRWGVTEMIDLLNNRKCKIRSKVLIPQDQYPGFNFVGKLLGQGGASLKKLQEETDVKMSILGAGSMRNERKEQDCLSTGEAKYQHLKQTLHLQIDCLAEPTEAYYRISHALAKVKEAMTPDPNELAQYYANQMQQINIGPGVPQPPPQYPVMGAAGGGRGGRGGGAGGPPFSMPIGAMGGPGGPGYGAGPMVGMRGGGRGRGRGAYPGGPGVPNGSGMHYGDHHQGGGGYNKPAWAGPVYRGGGGGGGPAGPRGVYQQQGGPGRGGGPAGGGSGGYAS